MPPTTATTPAPEAARREPSATRPATHPLAADAARLILRHDAAVAELTARRDALPQTDRIRAVLTHGISAVEGVVRQLEVYLPDGWDAAAVLAATCSSCGAEFGQRCSRDCRERYGELDD